MQLKCEHTLRQRHCQSIIRTQLTTNYFEGFFTWSPFCFYADCREFFWLQRTLFNISRSRPPNHKGQTSSFLPGSNYTCLIRVQPWTHKPIYSNSHSANDISPFPVLSETQTVKRCVNNNQAIGPGTWPPRQQHAPMLMDCESLIHRWL